MKRQWSETLIERIARHSESKTFTLCYDVYSITTAAIRDENTGVYSPLVQITWTGSDGTQVIRSFILPDQCFCAEEARFLALCQGKALADRHLDRVNVEAQCR